MPPWLHDLNVLLSDIGLYMLMACFTVLGIKARLIRNGALSRRTSEFILSLAFFFDWFGLVYIDRRYDIIPWADLHGWMGFEWYWPWRFLLVITFIRAYREWIKTVRAK